MPPIPLYQQQGTPQGLVNVEPSRAGSATGRVVEQVGGQVGAIGQQIASVMGQQNAAAEAAQMQIEAERRRRDEEDANLLAMGLAAKAESMTKEIRESWELDIDEGGNVKGNRPYKTFDEDAEAAHKSILEQASKTNPMVQKRLGIMLQQVRSVESEKLRVAQEKRRGAYVRETVENGIQADAQSVFASEDPQREFIRTFGSWDAQLGRRTIDDATQTADPRITWEDRDRLKEGARRLLTTTAEQKSLDIQGPENYLRERGLNPDGKPLTTTRRLRAGAAMPEKVLPWASDIESAATEAGVDPMLLAAVMEQESRGNASAKSPKGAIGLMQLMPGTAAELGVDPNDPKQNIRGGAIYLAKQLARYDGDVDKALAAYNAGPGAVDKAGGVPNFAETRDYVAKIRGRYDSMVEEVPAQVVQLPASWSKLTPEEQVRWREQGVRAASQKRAEGAESMQTWFSNAEALAKAGQVPQGAPSFADAVRVYGPDRGAQMWQQGQSLVRLGQNMAGLADLSNEEIQRRASALQPDPNDQNTFAVKSGVHGDFLQAADAVVRERNRDPLQWALQNNPDVKKAADVFVQAPTDPRARDAYVTASAAAQRRYGAASPKLLTEGQAQQVLVSLTDPTKYESVPGQVQQLAQQWGPHWPAVYTQLSKDLPPAVDVIASGVAPQTGATLARLMPVKTEDLRKSVLPDDRRTVSQEIAAAFDPFSRSLMATDASAGREKGSRFVEQGERLALHYIGQGMAAGPAVRRAQADLLDRYEFVEQEGSLRDPSGGVLTTRPVFRVPKDHDADLVEKGADRLKQSVDPANLFPIQGMQPGPWAAEIKRRGYWVTTPDETGLELHMGGFPVADKSQRKIVATWADLTAQANAPGFWGKFREGFTGQGATPYQPFDPSLRPAAGGDASRVAAPPRSPYQQPGAAQGIPGVPLR